MGKYNFKHQKKMWYARMEYWRIKIPTFHVYNEILMLEGFQPSIIEKIQQFHVPDKSAVHPILL